MNASNHAKAAKSATNKRTTIILGGGISGLAAARALQHGGRECLLLERCPTAGGLTRTVNVSEFCFDYTGHFLHLSECPTPADLPFASLDNADWQQVVRNSCCFVGGELIPAPIQYNLGRLPEPFRKDCIDSYEERPSLPLRENGSFRDFIVGGFGRELADIFLIPQNEKTMATSIDRLSMNAVRRFFPPPEEERIRAGIQGGASVKEYNSTFWYPRKGGIELLVHGLSRGMSGICFNEDVIGIDLASRTVRTASGGVYPYEHVLSSVPLPDLCRMSSDGELREMAEQLTFGSTVCINIGVRGSVPAALEGVHWVYVPDRDIPFYRVGCYSNISAGTCAPGHHSLYVEVGVNGEKIDRTDIVGRVQPEALDALVKVGWLDSRTVTCVATHVIRCAYVHLSPERERLLDDITVRLLRGGVRLIGRYGQWDYTGMEDCILSSVRIAEEVS